MKEDFSTARLEARSSAGLMDGMGWDGKEKDKSGMGGAAADGLGVNREGGGKEGNKLLPKEAELNSVEERRPQTRFFVDSAGEGIMIFRARKLF